MKGIFVMLDRKKRRTLNPVNRHFCFHLLPARTEAATQLCPRRRLHLPLFISLPFLRLLFLPDLLRDINIARDGGVTPHGQFLEQLLSTTINVIMRPRST